MNISFPSLVYELIEPEAAGWNSQRLEPVLDFVRARKTTQFLISFEGKLVLEDYQGCGPSDAGDVFSAQKSLVAILMGIAQEKSLLSLDESVVKYLGVGWTRLKAGVESTVTLRHLMNMTTGMDDHLSAAGVVGKTWAYNTGAYQFLKRVLTVAAGLSIDELMNHWLTGPLGMASTKWEPRVNMTYPDGEPVTGLVSNVRDMARLGNMILANGDWSGQSILSDKIFLKEMLSSSQEDNPAYGLLWWINGQSGFRRPMSLDSKKGSMVPAAPDDMVSCLGAFDQKIYVVPSWSTVICRRGGPAGVDPSLTLSAFDSELWEILQKARA